MRYLLFSLLFGTACASDYKGLTPMPVDDACAKKNLPAALHTSWFDAGVDVAGRHISGLLLFKNMPDSSRRVVFTNEAGVKFLDFEWTNDGEFSVHHAIRQLNKRSVIRLLRKDFELVMGTPFQKVTLRSWRKGDENFYGVAQKKETHYFITGKDCASLLRVETGAAKKRKVSMWFYGGDKHQPDSILLRHHTFAMEINLKRLTRE